MQGCATGQVGGTWERGRIRLGGGAGGGRIEIDKQVAGQSLS